MRLLKKTITNFFLQSIYRIYRPLIYLGNNRALTKTIYGHKMFLDTRDLSLTPHILLDGFWEKWISAIFLKEIHPGMAVIDIGANVGYYSILAAHAVGNTGRVYSFEANPEIHDILFQNLEINGFITIAQTINRAVYSENTTLEFKVYEKHHGSSSIWTNNKYAEKYNDKINIIKTNTTTLDSFFPPGSKVDFIKIDAEGAEPHILNGAKRLIKENDNPPILMEWAPDLLHQSNQRTIDLYNIITELGYKIYRINNDSSLVPSEFNELSSIEWCDVLLKKF